MKGLMAELADARSYGKRHHRFSQVRKDARSKNAKRTIER